jgi:hypothetical protein
MSTFRENLTMLVATEMSSWSSIEVSLEQELTLHVDVRKGHQSPAYNKCVYHYIETSDGQRLADIQYLYGDNLADHFMGYCDSHRSASVGLQGQFKQNTISVAKSFMSEAKRGDTERPDPLHYYYVGKVPLYEALAKAEYVGPGQVIGRTTHIFKFPPVRFPMINQSLIYNLDATRGIPLRVESYDTERAGDENSLHWRWEALSVDQVGSFYFPLRSKQTTFHLDSSGHVQKSATYDNKCVVKYNDKYSKETFWPVFQPGVSVFDSITMKHYRIASPNTEHTAAHTSQDPSAELIRATRPDGFYQATALFSLSLGFVSLLVGIILWAKRR